MTTGGRRFRKMGSLVIGIGFGTAEEPDGIGGEAGGLGKDFGSLDATNGIALVFSKGITLGWSEAISMVGDAGGERGVESGSGDLGVASAGGDGDRGVSGTPVPGRGGISLLRGSLSKGDCDFGPGPRFLAAGLVSRLGRFGLPNGTCP